jgi:hypothetical protein
MKFFSLLFLLGLVNIAVAQNSVIIELFTSQGCSSCPAADKNLAEIIDEAEKKGQHVFGLSFHVDYWNYLGWKDPYSDKEFTERQKRYASLMNSEGVYTPQMIVNGQKEFVGSDKNRSRSEVIAAQITPKQFEIELVSVEKAEAKLSITYSLDKAPVNQTINVALVANETNDVPRGENSGRKLTHKNVVRSFSSFAASKQGKLELAVPPSINYGQLIIFLQNTDWHVTGAVAKKL